MLPPGLLFLTQELLLQIRAEIAGIDGELPLGQLHDALREPVQKIAVVGHQQNGAVIFVQLLFQPFHGARIQVVGGLVQDEQVGLLEQGLNDGCPLALPAGQRRQRLLPLALGNAQPLQHGLGVMGRLPAAQPLHLVRQRGQLFQKSCLSLRRRALQKPRRFPVFIHGLLEAAGGVEEQRLDGGAWLELGRLGQIGEAGPAHALHQAAVRLTKARGDLK